MAIPTEVSVSKSRLRRRPIRQPTPRDGDMNAVLLEGVCKMKASKRNAHLLQVHMDKTDFDFFFEINSRTSKAVRVAVTTVGGADVDISKGLTLPGGERMEPAVFTGFIGMTEAEIVNMTGCGNAEVTLCLGDNGESSAVQTFLSTIYPGAEVLVERLFALHIQKYQEVDLKRGTSGVPLVEVVERWIHDPQTTPFVCAVEDIDPHVKDGLLEWTSRLFKKVEQRMKMMGDTNLN